MSDAYSTHRFDFDFELPGIDLGLDKLGLPDLTMPALVAELADLGVVAHPVTVWRLVRSEGLRFKKDAVRHRAGPTPGCATTGTVEDISGPD